MTIHSITSDNYLEAYQATRDILYLYDDAVTSYAGFGHNLETGSFDPFRYVSCQLAEPPGYTFKIDLQLLHEGAACALLCHLSDYWDDFEGQEISTNNLTSRIRKLAQEGHLNTTPLAKRAIEEAFIDPRQFRSSLREVYIKYILAYYQRRLSEGSVDYNHATQG